MRIISRFNNGRELTIPDAMSIVCDGEEASALHGVVVRLLEELTSDALGNRVLMAAQLSRVLAYKFRVEDV